MMPTFSPSLLGRGKGWWALFLYSLDLAVARLEEEAMAACGLCLVLLQFDGVPVYLVGTLRQRSVRDDAAVADEDDGRDATRLKGLIATVMDLSRLVVYPLALGQGDSAAVAALHEWGNEYLRSKHILVFHIPGTCIVRMTGTWCLSYFFCQIL